MQSNVDWPSIQQEYEQGISQRSLALKYGISQAAISKKAAKGKWIRVITPVIPRYQQPVIDDNPTSDSSELTPDVPALVAAALQGLANLDPQNFSLKEQKLFADALSQYHKIKLTLPTEQFAYDMRDFLRKCTPEELTIIQPIVEAVNQREAEEKAVKPLRKIG